MDYLECVRADIAEAKKNYDQAKLELELQLKGLSDKIKDLEKEEEKIMKRTKGLFRCSNCGEFVQNAYTSHERDSGSGMGPLRYDCKTRTKY